MTIDLSKLIFISTCSGFKNYDNETFSTTITGGSLAAGSYLSGSASATLDNSNSLSQVLVQFSGADSKWRPIPGILAINYPDNTSPNYQIEAVTYFKGGKVHVDVFVSNQAGVSVTVPDLTINCRAFLFKAPF